MYTLLLEFLHHIPSNRECPISLAQWRRETKIFWICALCSTCPPFWLIHKCIQSTVCVTACHMVPATSLTPAIMRSWITCISYRLQVSVHAVYYSELVLHAHTWRKPASKYVNPNGRPFLFRRFASNVLYCRRVQIVALSFFFVKNTFTIQRIIWVCMSRMTAKNDWVFV